MKIYWWGSPAVRSPVRIRELVIMWMVYVHDLPIHHSAYVAIDPATCRRAEPDEEACSPMAYMRTQFREGDRRWRHMMRLERDHGHRMIDVFPLHIIGMAVTLDGACLDPTDICLCKYPSQVMYTQRFKHGFRGKTVKTPTRFGGWRISGEVDLSATVTPRYGGLLNYLRVRLCLTCILQRGVSLGLISRVDDASGFWVHGDLVALANSVNDAAPMRELPRFVHQTLLGYFETLSDDERLAIGLLPLPPVSRGHRRVREPRKIYIRK